MGGIRSIEILEEIPNPLVIYWIRHFTRLFKKEIDKRSLADSSKIYQYPIFIYYLPIIKKDQKSIFMDCC